MHFATILAVPAVLFGLASAAPTAVGPSGSIISPAGGTNIPSTQGYPTGKINFSYKPVYITKSGNCGYYGCTAQTWYVSVGLKDASGKTTMLAENLGSDTVGANINAVLTVPKNFCGDYNLVVREYQNLYGNSIDFQAAAPKIHIECDPLP